MKRIFIGGTGRSGTTVLQHALSFHPQLYTIPIETKFIVQSDGLYSLVQHLTDDYSITDASIAIARFKTLMHEVVTHTGPNPYAELAGQPYGRLEFVPQELFPNYWQALDEFFGQISNRYYTRAELLPLAATLIDSLFSDQATSRAAEGWAEKTPSNLFRIEFLFEMFPDAVFINCVRDPRGVLDSFMRKEWIGGSLQDGAEYLRHYYAYVAAKRQFGLQRPHNYCEVRLESMVADPLGELGRLLGFLQLGPWNTETHSYLLNVFQQGSIRWNEAQNRLCDTWETRFSAEEIAGVNAILGKVIKEYGYPLD